MKFEGHKVHFDFTKGSGWRVSIEICDPFNHNKERQGLCLHNDGYWRKTTVVNGVYSGYFSTKKIALETLSRAKETWELAHLNWN